MKPMKKIDTYIYKLGLWAGAALSLTACVDEDLSDCPPNVEMREITVSYQIDLQHGVDPEFEAELLSLHLGFWNSPQNLYRDLVFQPEDMPEELFFKVTLPVDNYDHLAVANHNNDRVGGGLHTFDNVLEDVVVDETPISPDTVKALAYPPFSGVLSMRMEEEKDGTLHRIDEPGGGQGETSREPPRDDEKHQMLSLPHATRILVLGGRLHQQRPAEDGRIGLQSDRGGAAHRV